jgi:hypothetical protein
MAPLRPFCRSLSLLTVAACASESGPAPVDSPYCAALFNQLDAMEFTPQPGNFGFDFREMQLARIRQARCITFTDQLIGMETLASQLSPHSVPAGPVYRFPVAVQAGVVTNPNDEVRALAFFSSLGYRARSVGWPELGTRVYVEARTANQVSDIVSLAQQAGFVGPYPSSRVAF